MSNDSSQEYKLWLEIWMFVRGRWKRWRNANFTRSTFSREVQINVRSPASWPKCHLINFFFTRLLYKSNIRLEVMLLFTQPNHSRADTQDGSTSSCVILLNYITDYRTRSDFPDRQKDSRIVIRINNQYSNDIFSDPADPPWQTDGGLDGWIE